MTGIRGTGKTVLLGEFASRGEGSGWVCLERELGDRHRDEDRLIEAVQADCDALIRKCDALAGVGQAVERGLRFLRPRRVVVGEIGVEPAYEAEPSEPAEILGDALIELDRAVGNADRPGALLLYDEAHMLADDRRRGQYPLSSLLTALGRVQRQAPRVRIMLCGLPTLTLNLKRARTYAERMFRHIVIANLERGDAWDALGIPLAGSGRSFGLNLVGDIVEETDGYPYFLQFFGGLLCSRVPKATVERADYRALERGLICRPSRGRYDFALPLFRSYLRRRANLTQLSRAR